MRPIDKITRRKWINYIQDDILKNTEETGVLNLARARRILAVLAEEDGPLSDFDVEQSQDQAVITLYFRRAEDDPVLVRVTWSGDFSDFDFDWLLEGF